LPLRKSDRFDGIRGILGIFYKQYLILSGQGLPLRQPFSIYKKGKKCYNYTDFLKRGYL